MTTISVPINAMQEEFINSFIKRGLAPNKAVAIRRAINLLAEEEAVTSVLKAEQELLEGKILRGDPRKILRKFQKNA